MDTEAAPSAPAAAAAAAAAAVASSSSSITTPSRPPSSASARSTNVRTRRSRSDLILGIAVVDFNHLQGPIVEWSYPASLQADHADLTSSLPFCALPDGSHLSDEDFAHFHLYCPSISKRSTIFGISCNRQIAADKLTVRAKDVTRSTVQKAVVVLARQVSSHRGRPEQPSIQACADEQEYSTSLILLSFLSRSSHSPSLLR